MRLLSHPFLNISASTTTARAAPTALTPTYASGVPDRQTVVQSPIRVRLRCSASSNHIISVCHQQSTAA